MSGGEVDANRHPTKMKKRRAPTPGLRTIPHDRRVARSGTSDYRIRMSVADSEFMALQTAVAGRFSLEREIGRGGMGIVFLARDVLLERPVAIKLLLPSLGARNDMGRRFLREARIAAQCFHPHIVPIHAVEEGEGLAWIVMPYVRGETLAERVRRLGPLPAEEVRRLAREVGWALAYAHQRGVVHRDIKPENILIEAASGRFLIADFGIARGGDSETTTSGVGAGTPRYMAPEQALGEVVDGRADLYALGATLYVAATGRPPFVADTTMALITQHATALAPAVRTLAPALPVALADAIDRCLAKRPEDRHENAERFVEALTPAVGETTASAALAPLANDARNARLILGLAAASEVTVLLLALGEPTGTLFGRGTTIDIGTWISSLIALGGTALIAETVLKARRLLREGQSRDDVVKALAGEVLAVPLSPASRAKRVLAALIGAVIAVAEPRLVDSPSIPIFLGQVLAATMTVGPVVLITRGVSGVLAGTAFSRALHDWIGLPVARVLARLAGRGIPSAGRLQAPLDNAATEVLLDRAIQEAIAQLPSSLRPTIGNAAELASSLAREAESLRRQDAQLVDEARAARHAAEGESRDAQLASLDRAREAVRGRLGTTIAALEAVRLEILRLDAGQSLPPGLTTNLEAVRDLGRRIDADAEVKALLDSPSPSPSNP
jgi:serine/threonine-protein kinase